MRASGECNAVAAIRSMQLQEKNMHARVETDSFTEAAIINLDPRAVSIRPLALEFLMSARPSFCVTFVPLINNEFGSVYYA